MGRSGRARARPQQTGMHLSVKYDVLYPISQHFMHCAERREAERSRACIQIFVKTFRSLRDRPSPCDPAAHEKMVFKVS